MKPTFYFFTHLDANHPIHAAFDIKLGLKSAELALHTVPSRKITVVYPMPWQLPIGAGTTASSMRSLWLDYYIDAAALHQEFPERVALWPWDVFICKHIDDPAIQAQCAADGATLDAQFDSVPAFLLNNSQPEVLEFLELLESHAHLEDRTPYVRPLEDRMTPEILATVEVAVAERSALQAELNTQQHFIAQLKTQLEAEQHKAAQALKQAQEAQQKLSEAECKAAQAADAAKKTASSQTIEKPESKSAVMDAEALNEVSLLLEQLHMVQEELETEVLAKRQLEAQLLAAQTELSQLKTVTAQAAMHQAYPAGHEPSQGSAFGSVLGSALSSDDLLIQLHQSQDELERYYLYCETLKDEARQATAVLDALNQRLLNGKTLRLEDLPNAQNQARGKA